MTCADVALKEQGRSVPMVAPHAEWWNNVPIVALESRNMVDANANHPLTNDTYDWGEPKRDVPHVSQTLLAACKQAMHCLTAETEEEWRQSQAHPESPYHFLYRAITEAEHS